MKKTLGMVVLMIAAVGVVGCSDSAKKGNKEVEFAPTNLHLQRMWVQNEAKNESEFIYCSAHQGSVFLKDLVSHKLILFVIPSHLFSSVLV